MKMLYDIKNLIYDLHFSRSSKFNAAWYIQIYLITKVWGDWLVWKSFFLLPTGSQKVIKGKKLSNMRVGSHLNLRKPISERR
jgi:hypothetical protein